MPLNDLFKWRLESAQKYDDSERGLGDVLDVKASVALVAVTFLAGVSAQLITVQGESPLWSKVQLTAQLVALPLLAAAGALIVAELWPKGYASLPTPKQDADWIERLNKELGDNTAVMEKVLSQKLSSAVTRVEHNKQLNDRKSRLLGWIFSLLAGAMVLILGNLIFLALRATSPVLKSLFKCG